MRCGCWSEAAPACSPPISSPVISMATALPRGEAVRCPALVVTGARDIMAPPRNAQGLIAALADVQTVSLAETGHAMMAERPGEVLDALRNFLKGA